MEILIWTLAVTAIIAGFLIWAIKRKHRKEGAAEGDDTQEPRIIDTLAEALKELQCDYETNEKEYAISFVYQGERFIAYDLDEDNSFITIADTWWHESPVDDIDNLALMRRAVNDCNFNSIATLLYSINTDSKTVGLHTRMTILWIQQIPKAKEYLQAILDQILRTHHLFFDKMEELRRLDLKQGKQK